MLQLTPQMRILVAVEPADFRRGIDGLARLCRESLGADPFVGTVFVFRNRRGTALKLLTYDGQGFWLCQKRLSQGRFPWWPVAAEARLSGWPLTNSRCCWPPGTRRTRVRQPTGVRSARFPDPAFLGIFANFSCLNRAILLSFLPFA